MSNDHEDDEPTGEPLKEGEQTEVISSLNQLLRENYVFPDVAERMVKFMEKKLDDKTYHSITDTQLFSGRLTEDLQSISHDKHLRVVFDPKEIQEMRSRKESDNDELPEERLKLNQFSNFGFQEVKILLGNIGYLDLKAFYQTGIAGDTAVAAMAFLANCSALIIDLRQNGGGSPTMIQLLTSYLFDGRKSPIHLNTFYWRPEDELQQIWTIPHVPGKRMPDIEVYVLTSARTFSAAEEFAYNLQNLKRATIVGETTGGGAHPGGTEIVTDRFVVRIPKGRAINPITKTNWEGVGVKPDIPVDKEKALDVAHVKALEHLIAKDTDAVLTKLFKKHLEILKKKQEEKRSPSDE